MGPLTWSTLVQLLMALSPETFSHIGSAEQLDMHVQVKDFEWLIHEASKCLRPGASKSRYRIAMNHK